MLDATKLNDYINKCKDDLGGDEWLKHAEETKLGYETMGAIIKRYITNCYITGTPAKKCVENISKRFPQI